MWIKKITPLIAIILLPHLNAATEVHTRPLICRADTVRTLSGNNADLHITTWRAAMSVDKAQLIYTIQNSSKLIAASVGESGKELEVKIAEVSQNHISKTAEVQKSLLLQKQSAELNLKNRKLQSESGLNSSSNKETIEFILDFLETHGIPHNRSIIEIEALIKSLYPKDPSGGKGITLPIVTLEGEKFCSEEEIADKMCSTVMVTQPDEIMMTYFQLCNTVKTKQVSAAREAQARKGAIIQEANETEKSINNTSTQNMVAEKRENIIESVCTPQLKMSGVCGNDISDEDFQEMVARNEIVVNGHLSASNALSPSSFDMGFVAMTENPAETAAALQDEAFDYSDFDNNPMQNAEAIPIINTYRNSTQLKAALSFFDNLLGDGLIENQETRFRNNPRSAEFQVRYHSRLASLNLARTTFLDSVKVRTGQKLGEIWSGEGETTLDELNNTNVVKESYLGAGELDILLSQVNSAYSEISLSDGTVDVSSRQAALSDTNEKYWLLKNYEMMNLQNQILFRQMMQNERSELLKAAQLQKLVNSPEVIDYLNSIRGGN